MSFGSLLLLSLGLAMDATAVSAARGLAVRRILPRHVLLVAAFFGGFQALMPLVGWQIGIRAGAFAQAWDHWIAFTLLAGIGGKMIWEAASLRDAEVTPGRDLFGLHVMFLLAVATSIDAFAVGITLPMLGAPMAASLVTIGVTTAVTSAIGLFAGRRFGAALGPRLDVVGGVVLIGIGSKILIGHLTGA